MKITVLGDIHGRTCWKKIIKDESDSDLFIFLGDYVSTHEDVDTDTQINNLIEIFEFKEENPDKVILLRGNHDMQHLGYSWAECSGLFKNVMNWMSSTEVKERYLNNTQWIYTFDNIIFSHAGISDVWLNDNKIDISNINNLEPSDIFGFTPDNLHDYSGTSKTQPLTWIRPQTLAICCIDGYTQVVGHTPVNKIIDIYKAVKKNNHIWLCDRLTKEYLIINKDENGEYNYETKNLVD